MTAAGQATAPGARSWWDPKSPYWLIRIGGFVAVTALTLSRSGNGHRAFVITVLAVGGLLLALWGVLDWQDRHATPWPAWLRVVMLSALAAVGGTGAALSPARAVVAFAIMAAIAAGNDLPSGPAAAVTAIGMLGIELGGLIFGFSATNAVGLPLVLVVSLLAGRNRRDARIRAAQAAALVTRTQQAQADQRRAAALEERTRIAREIHDVLAQSLSALGVQIEAARSVLSDTGDIGCATGLLEQASQLADAGLGETRQAIHALRADTPALPGGLASLAESRLLAGLGSVGRAETLGPHGEPGGAGDHHGNGHENECVGDRRGGDGVLGHPVGKLRAEPVHRAVRKRGAGADDHDPQDGVGDPGPADRLARPGAAVDAHQRGGGQAENDAGGGQRQLEGEAGTAGGDGLHEDHHSHAGRDERPQDAEPPDFAVSADVGFEDNQQHDRVEDQGFFHDGLLD